MNYPRQNPNMPPLPNNNMQSHLPYPPSTNQPMPMPVPYQPAQSGNQFGFVPPNAHNPNPLPFSSYPAQPVATTPYPQMPASQFSGAYPSATSGYPSNPNPSSAQAYPTHSNPSIYPGQSNPSNPSAYPGQSNPSNPSTYPGQTNPLTYPGQANANPSTYPNQSYGSNYPTHSATQHNPNMYAPQQQQQRGNTGHFQQTSSGSMNQIPKGNPTVIPAPNFDANADAQILRTAMKGFGTDEDGITSIICRRSNRQIQEIKRAFKTNYGKDLVAEIRSETSGNYELLLLARLCPINEFYAKELHDAIAGIGTNEVTLIEILASLSNSEMNSVKQEYARMFRKTLEDDLINDTSGHFKRLLVSLCNASRDESGNVDHSAADRDANALLEAGVKRWGTDESTFNMIFCQRNLNQIKLIVEKYQQKAGHTLEKAVKREFSGDIEKGLVAVLRCAVNKNEFFARCLQQSMVGCGTKDNQLIRLIVTRCEIDLADIKVEFQRKYGKTLQSWIKGDTSGHYKKALLMLVGQ